MDLTLLGMGIVFDIDATKFVADGALYVNEDYYEKEQNKDKINLMSSFVASMFFENKTREILEELDNQNNLKTAEYRNKEINDFFAKKHGRVLDLIMMTDNGIRGTDKVILQENSIIYFKIHQNLKLGFFINKTMAKIIFDQIGVDFDGSNIE